MAFPHFAQKLLYTVSSLSFVILDSNINNLTERNIDKVPSDLVQLQTFPTCCKGNSILEYFHCDYVYESRSVFKIPKHLFSAENNITFEKFKPKCGLEKLELSMDSFQYSGNGRFLPSRYFEYDKRSFSRLEYCINGITEDALEVLTCTPKCSENNPCIQKCCLQDEIYSFARRQCVKTTVEFSPTFYLDMDHKLDQSKQKHLLPNYVTNFPRSFKYKCGENRTQFFPAGKTFASFLSNFTHTTFESADFRIRADGLVIYRRNGYIEGMKEPDGTVTHRYLPRRKCYKLRTEHYCIEGATDYGNSHSFSNMEEEMFLATCTEFLLETPPIGRISSVYGNTMMCSSLFALLTAVVYLILEEKQNLHGWSVISHSLSLFFMYVFLGLAHLIRYYGTNAVLKTSLCTIIGIASHFFSMASYVWLTILNFQLWKTFKSIKPNKVEYRQRSLGTLYMRHAVVGWGFPIAVITVCLCLHLQFEEGEEEDCAEPPIPLPAYGRESCEIKQLSLGVYFYYPAAALLFCNLLFFAVTVYKLCHYEQTTSLARITTTGKQHQSMVLFAKLFFVMGVTRVFEVVTWAQGGPDITDLPWYWVLFDIFNALQAVAIFLIYVCKQDVVKLLKKKFPRQSRLLCGIQNKSAI